MISSFYYDWEYWELRHKVTFDGTNRLILVNYGETILDFKSDIYSAWKQWVMLQNHTQNAAYPQAMRSVGGDPIPGGFLGSTFFLMNGWKLKTWEGDHQLTINGNYYTEDGSAPFVPTDQRWNIVINTTVSSLPQTATGAGECPTATEIATEVQNTLYIPSETSIANEVSSVLDVPTTNAIAAAVRDAVARELAMLREVWAMYGLNPTAPLVVGENARTVGTIQQNISDNGSQTTVTRTSALPPDIDT